MRDSVVGQERPEIGAGLPVVHDTMAIMTATAKFTAEWLHSLGDVPLERIIFDPPPGTATEEDLLRLVERDKRLCELIDRVLSIRHAPGMGHRPQSSDRGGLSQAG